MSEQPNALRLAKWLDAMPSSGYALPNQAATELRRLHEEVNEQSRLLGMSAERELALLAKIDRLERQLETPLYTSPQPAQRKPLTDEQIGDLWNGHTVPVFGKTGINPIVFARAIEAAHGIKGDA